MVTKRIVAELTISKAKMSRLPRLAPANQLLSVEQRQVRDEEIKNSIHAGLPPRTRRGKFSHGGPRKRRNVDIRPDDIRTDDIRPDNVLDSPSKQQYVHVAEASRSESGDHPVHDLLESVFRKRQESSDLWPRLIEQNLVRDCIQSFRRWMVGDGHATACCAVCAQLVPPKERSQLMVDGPKLEFLMDNCRRSMGEEVKKTGCAVVNREVLDSCGQNINGSFEVCKTCVESLRRLQIPRLSIANNLFCGCCESQLSYLAGLTQVEEMVIARGRAFGSIIKLRPYGTNPGVCYRRVKGHVVVVPLQPQSLLNMLPCSTDDLMDRIQARCSSSLHAY